MTIEDAKLLAKQLTDLLDDPHPGLHSWLMAFKGTCEKISEMGKLS